MIENLDGIGSTTAGQNLTSVAIIGRPNVGKSTLFNILTDSRKSVVKDQPGVTRDLISEEAELWGKSFEVIDTGGLTESDDIISQLILEQVVGFLKSVDMLICVMDGRAGLCPEDRDIIRIAKEAGKPFVILVNKVDKVSELDIAGSEFYEFGAEVFTCSLERRIGLDPLLQWLHDSVTSLTGETYEDFTLSIVGKPNVGKSSLFNQLLGKDRMLVSDIAGTTVDSVDVRFKYDDRQYTIIDTAGLRRSSRREDDIEIIAAFKTQKAIKKAELVLLVIDGTIGPTDQDAKILEAIVDAHKGVIVVVNKSDLGDEMDEYRKTVRAQVANVFHFYNDVPVTFISAKTGRGIKDLFQLVEKIREKLYMKIPTGELNDFFMETIRLAPAPVFGVKNVKFYYLTQTRQFPPSFIAFANFPDGVDNSYRRFLIKHMKARWGLEGIPIRIFVMKSRRS
ncbi:MAG: ribosome biogenesis GTPase Der [Bdellovibrionales bacterium]|nr:ribosome biogenesis GTPase Der [Bdellovibrionales bacterium]